MVEEDDMVLRREFHAFWQAGLRGHDYLSESAIVCFLDLDQESVTLTRVFHCSGEESDGERAEDRMIDWLWEDQLVQAADSVDMNIYMNYSPLKLTGDGLIALLKNLKATGKEVKVTIRFVELFNAGEGEEDSEENREGLRQLVHYGVEVGVMKGRDWQFLMTTLTRKGGKKRQANTNASVRARLTEILHNPRHAHTNTETCDTCDAEIMTDPPPPDEDSSSDSED